MIPVWFGVRTLLIELGNPWEDGRHEISNGRHQDYVLDRKGVATLRGARRLGYDSVPAAPSAGLQPAANARGRSLRYNVSR